MHQSNKAYSGSGGSAISSSVENDSAASIVKAASSIIIKQHGAVVYILVYILSWRWRKHKISSRWQRVAKKQQLVTCSSCMALKQRVTTA